ncbi:NUDIX domain-containing protein [Streptomyces sp. NPDC048291]|uniref:NUDIX hydrolase n=1 Tax=Streptomyces sp. NPDC048291 TaxID=3365530 RepID=UPI003720A27B
MSALGEAATVVLLRDGPQGPRVLMLLRPAHGSYPGAWVFPGGAVDPADRVPDGTGAVRRAAVRETREETGLAVAAGELQLLSCWTPPPQAPKRLRTWFFLGAAPPGRVVRDPREVAAHRWLAPGQALKAHGEGRLQLLPPTWVTLHGLVGVPTVEAACERARTVRPPHYESRHVVDPATGPVLVWAGDVAHAEGVPLERPGPRHRLLLGSRSWTYVVAPERRGPFTGETAPDGTCHGTGRDVRD